MAQGPLSRYLGRRDINQAADMQGLGLLARIQAEQQARALNEQFRRDQLAATVSGQEEARKSRESIAEQARIAAQLRSDEQNALRRELTGNTDLLRRDISRAQIEATNQRSADTNALRRELADQNEKLRRDLAAQRTPPAQVSPQDAARIVQEEGAKLLGIIGTNPQSAASLLSPLNRGIEAARGVIDPNYTGPALNAQSSKQRLLFAIDQLVKSGKSSNEFLRRLESSIGMNTVTTPANAEEAIREAINLSRGISGLPPIDTPPVAPGAKPGRRPLSSFDR